MYGVGYKFRIFYLLVSTILLEVFDRVLGKLNLNINFFLILC